MAEEKKENPVENTEEVKAEEIATEETKTEEVVEEAKVEDAAFEPEKKEKKMTEAKRLNMKHDTTIEAKEEVVEAKEEVKEEAEAGAKKAEVEEKIRKQIKKKQEKNDQLAVYRIAEYLKEEHQWENWLFLAVSIITLVLGCLMLNGALVVRDDFPLLGDYPQVFAWILVGLASLGLLYALYPFLKPAFPELKKITWLTMPKFIGNSIRTFTFIIIFTLLFILYDTFLTEILNLIF